jgi:hypothetical protein
MFTQHINSLFQQDKTSKCCSFLIHSLTMIFNKKAAGLVAAATAVSASIIELPVHMVDSYVSVPTHEARDSF